MGKRARVCMIFLLLTGLFSGTMLFLSGEGFVYRKNEAVTAQAELVTDRMTAVRTTVILDAGHGGEDGGAVSSAGAAEKSLNLSIALTLGDMLSSCGVDVIYTRTDDNNVDDIKRVELANNVKADMFISIHTSFSEDVRVAGVTTNYNGKYFIH